MLLIKDTMNMLSYCFLNCNYSTVLTMEDSQKESSHSSLQLGEFEGTFYKFYKILIFCVIVFLVSLLLPCSIFRVYEFKKF